MPSFIDPTSKTFWTGLGLIGLGIYGLFTGQSADHATQTIMEGLGLIFLRNAIANNGVRSFVLLMGLGILFVGNPGYAQTPTNTLTPVPPTATNTPVPATHTRTPSITPTITETPDRGAAHRASHVTAMELTILKGNYDLPAYSQLCINSSYDPSTPDVCRCVIYFARISGTIGLYARCPDGSIKQITTIP